MCVVHPSSKAEDEKGFVSAEGEIGTPESLPEPERPPLRHIDKYIRPECPCLSKRYTMAVLTCVGTACCSFSRRNDGVTKNIEYGCDDAVLRNLLGTWYSNWTPPEYEADIVTQL